MGGGWRNTCNDLNELFNPLICSFDMSNGLWTLQVLYSWLPLSNETFMELERSHCSDLSCALKGGLDGVAGWWGAESGLSSQITSSRSDAPVTCRSRCMLWTLFGSYP